jgi:hypothetical protein
MTAPRDARAWRGPLLSISSVFLAAGCASKGPAFESAATLPDEPRYPAGAEIDAPTSLPPARTQGDTGDGLVVLEAPSDPRRARATVDAFFRAMIEESSSALEAVLAPDALVQAGSRREPARSYYLGRFLRLDYRALRGESLFHPGDVEVWERSQGGEVRASPAPLEPAAGQIVIRVRITFSWAGRPRLFGDELVFRLAMRGKGFVITEIVEDFSAS